MHDAEVREPDAGQGGPDGEAAVAEPGRREPPTTGRYGVRVGVDRRSVLAFATAALVAALVAGAVSWFSRPTSEPVTPPVLSSAESSEVPSTAQDASTSSAAPTIVVSVIGYVVTPGLVTLPEGARVADAIAACGGVTPGADLTTVNLARKLADGEQIAVGVPGVADDGTSAGTSGEDGSAPAAAKININTASAEDLDSLPGIGPVIAARIVDFRTKNGKFGSVEDLTNVSGIGPSIMANVKDLVTV